MIRWHLTMLGIFLFYYSTWASQISLSGVPQIQLKRTRDSVRIQGSYTMLNAGDEVAKQVFPEVMMDLYSYRGQPVDLGPGEKRTWNWIKDIPHTQFCSIVRKKCPVILPLSGQVLVHIQNHYQDANGYQFVVPQVSISGFGNFDPNPSRQAEVVLKIKKISNEIFQADYEVHNKLDVDMSLKLDAVLPREMETLGSVGNLVLKEKASLFGSFHFRNKKGLNGSRYYAYFTAQWENAGERHVTWAFAPFVIGAQAVDEAPIGSPAADLSRGFLGRFSADQKFWLGWGILAFLGFLLMNHYWVKPLQKMK